jgi:thiamine pyrophosphokinase
MSEKIVAIFVNGEFKKTERIQNVVQQAEFIVGVDGGLHHIVNMGLTPHIIIGDLDSIDLEDLAYFENLGIDIRKFPEKKNETDLELAIDYVVNLGFEKIYVLGATGGHIDHFLGNLLLFSNPVYQNLEIILMDSYCEIFYVRTNQLIHGEPGDRLSLIPISETVCGVRTVGLKYPLKNEDLVRWKTRGISNQLMDHIAKVDFDSGSLLCVHHFGDKIIERDE